MKAEFADINETRKNVRVEISPEVVGAEIDRVARDYARRANVPGFRAGKAPAGVVKRRFKEQILSEVAHDLIPRAVGDALREHGVEPLGVPDVSDVVLEEGQPLTFTASFDTVPSFDPGDYSTLSLPLPSVQIDEESVASAIERLRTRAARFEPIEDRGVGPGDFVLVDLERQEETGGATSTGSPAAHPERRQNLTVEIGAKANPPGFDEALIGLEAGATKTFTVRYPDDHVIRELAGRAVTYTVTLNSIKRRVLPDLDDEFAKDLGIETLDALRARVRADIEQEAQRAAEGEMRAALMKQLAARVPFEPPGSLVERELDRRIEVFAHGLSEQRIDPHQAGIDWPALRESQRESAREAVASALALDEVARREHLEVTDEDVEHEIEHHAERTGRTPIATRAAIEKEGGLSRLQAGLRREKAIDFVTARAKILGGS
jgi:trigger factor